MTPQCFLITSCCSFVADAIDTLPSTRELESSRELLFGASSETVRSTDGSHVSYMTKTFARMQPETHCSPGLKWCPGSTCSVSGQAVSAETGVCCVACIFSVPCTPFRFLPQYPRCCQHSY